MNTVQDPADLVASVKEKIRHATDQAAVTTKQMPVLPWRDTTNKYVEEMVISTDQLILVVPEEAWNDIVFEIPPILDQLVTKAMEAEERAQNEWERRRAAEDKLVSTEEKVNGWRVIAEDINGVLFSDRAKVAEARVTELEEALSFYADHDNWSPEPRIIEAGVSVNDRGGVARKAMGSKK